MNISTTVLSFFLAASLTAPIPVVPVQPWQVRPNFSTKEDSRANLQVACALELLGDLAFSQDALVDAESFYRRAKVMFGKLKDVRHMASCSGKLAVALGEQDRLADSKQESEEALSYYDQLYPLQDINKGALLHNLGWVCLQQGNRKEALRWYSQAVRYYRSFGDDPMAKILGALGKRAMARIYAEERNYSLSGRYYRECLHTLQRYLTVDSSLLKDVRREYAFVKKMDSSKRKG